MTARIERIGAARPEASGRDLRAGWTGGAPWAGLAVLAVAVGLWVAVVAGVAMPLGAWLARMDGTPAPRSVVAAPAEATPARSGQALARGGWPERTPPGAATP